MRGPQIAIALGAGIFLSLIAYGDNLNINYPSGYRDWKHVKSMLIQPGHPLEDPFAGIHHIYANSTAIAGLASGNYSSGAIFVFDLLNYDESNKTIVETDRKRIDVMEFDPERFGTTDGWGYTTFVGDSTKERLQQDVAINCHACHTGAQKSGYIFSQYRP
jgi:hypothetical protein